MGHFWRDVYATSDDVMVVSAVQDLPFVLSPKYQGLMKQDVSVHGAKF